MIAHVDLTCSSCDGSGESPLWHEEGPTDTLWPCPHCTAGRRRPTVAEWDALVAQRDRLAAVVKAVQQRDEAIYLTAEDREALGWETR